MAANLDRRCRLEHWPRLQVIGEDLKVERADLKLNYDIDHGDGDGTLDDDADDSLEDGGTEHCPCLHLVGEKTL